MRGFDLIAAALLAITIIVFTTLFDIFIHDTFVLPSYHCDDPAQANNPECIPINSTTTIPILQYEITGRQWYWVFFVAMSWFLSIIPALFRGYVLGSVKAGFMWIATIQIPLAFGAEDVLYFTLRNLDIPDPLPWLNQNPFIGTVNTLTTHAPDITAQGLIYSLIAGLAILAVLWFFALRHRHQYQ